jgi:hypothetical protein
MNGVCDETGRQSNHQNGRYGKTELEITRERVDMIRKQQARQSVHNQEIILHILFYITGHIEINRLLKVKSYFCQPYHSWEKGTVENTNGLIRRFFPKDTNFDTISESDIAIVENWLNNRPRKCLNYFTPQEVFNSTVALAT